MATTIQIIGVNIIEEINTNRERYARAVKAAFANGAERVTVVDGDREVGWIERDGRAHFQPAPVLPFDGFWPFDG